LEKPNESGAPVDVRGIVIGSTYRRCSAKLAVAESSIAVAEYLMGQYANFLQFAGQKNGATRCNQIVQMLLANHVNYEVSNPLVSVQFDASNAFCSILRQPQFDVLAGKASRRYDNGTVEIGDELPKPHTLDKYWNYFESMQGNTSIIRFSDNQGTTHHLLCSKGGHQGDGLETIRFAVTVHPSIVRVCERHLGCKVVVFCDDISIVGSLSDALSCAAELKQILKADLDMVLNVSKSNLYFPNPALNIVQARSIFDLAVNADLSLSDLADMGAGISTDGMRVAGVLIGIDDCVKAFVAKKARTVLTNVAKLDVVTDGLIHLQLLNFYQNIRLAFFGRNTPTPLISEILAQVDDTIVEAVCRNGTGGGHVDWTHEDSGASLRYFGFLFCHLRAYRLAGQPRGSPACPAICRYVGARA